MYFLQQIYYTYTTFNLVQFTVSQPIQVYFGSFLGIVSKIILVVCGMGGPTNYFVTPNLR